MSNRKIIDMGVGFHIDSMDLLGEQVPLLDMYKTAIMDRIIGLDRLARWHQLVDQCPTCGGATMCPSLCPEKCYPPTEDPPAEFR